MGDFWVVIGMVLDWVKGCFGFFFDRCGCGYHSKAVSPIIFVENMTDASWINPQYLDIYIFICKYDFSIAMLDYRRV